MSANQTKTVSEFCNKCGHPTNHAVLSSHRVGGGGDDDMQWDANYSVIQCLGCEEICFRREYSDETMHPESETTRYPAATRRRRPTWIWKLDDDLRQILEEVYRSLYEGGRSLPTMGARAILDMVIRDKVGDRGNFKSGLQALVDDGLIGLHDSKILEAAINTGHASAHRGHRPETSDVERVLEIVEHLLRAQYILKEEAKSLSKTTPKRRKR